MTDHRQVRYTAARVPDEPLQLRPPLRFQWSFGDTAWFALVQSGHAFVVDQDRGSIACVDEHGKEVWAGETGSPALDGDYLLVTTYNEANRRLVAYHAQTGEVMRSEPCDVSLRVHLPHERAFIGTKMRQPEPSVFAGALCRISYAGDVLETGWEIRYVEDHRLRLENIEPGFDIDVACDAERVFVGRGQYLLALDLHDGHQVWSAPLKEVGGAPMMGKWTPAVAEGVVVITVLAGTAGFSAATGERLWLSPHGGGRAVYGGRVYLTPGDYCILDLHTGECLLKFPLADVIERRWRLSAVSFPTDVAVSETHGFVGDYRGRLYAFERDTGEPIWMDRPKGITGFSGNVPVIAGNRLYISSFSMAPAPPPRLYCYQGAE